MAERWRRPLVVYDVEPGDEVVVVNGRIMRSNKVIYNRESTERIRHGYACANCMEVFEVPWPERCSFCGVPVKERQGEYFEREVETQIARLGPRKTLSEELEGIHERAEEARRDGS